MAVFRKRGKAAQDNDQPEYPSAVTPDAEYQFAGTDDGDAIAAQFGSEAEGVWDEVEDSPLTGAVGASLTPVPDDLLHSARVKSVRFQIASPSGYYFPQVEEFVRQVTDALDRWEALVHERDVYIHSLNRELELQRRDVRSLRTQIEIFRVQGDALVKSDGSYVTESQVAAAPAAAAVVSSANEEELVWLREQVAALQDERSLLQQQVDAHADNLLVWQDAVAQRDELITSLQDEVSTLTQDLAAARTTTMRAPQPPAGPPAQQPYPQAQQPYPTQPYQTPAAPQQPFPPAATAPMPAQPVAAPTPQQAPPAPTAPVSAPVYAPQTAPVPVNEYEDAAPAWTPEGGWGAQPQTAPDPRLASPGRVTFEEQSPMSVWAPDMINTEIELGDDDETGFGGDGFPDTAFRNR